MVILNYSHVFLRRTGLSLVLCILEYVLGQTHSGGSVIGGSGMNKDKQKPCEDFMMSFFDFVDPVTQSPDLAAKQNNIIKYTDSFTIFKVEDNARKSI